VKRSSSATFAVKIARNRFSSFWVIGSSLLFPLVRDAFDSRSSELILEPLAPSNIPESSPVRSLDRGALLHLGREALEHYFSVVENTGRSLAGRSLAAETSATGHVCQNKIGFGKLRPFTHRCLLPVGEHGSGFHPIPWALGRVLPFGREKEFDLLCKIRKVTSS
jgi:hypothetical protein